jgi:AraC-like DNA-binding protein
MQSYIKNLKYSDEVKKIGAHHHDTHQILYVLNGNAQITVNNANYDLESGSLIFISRTESHSVNFVGEKYERYEIRISPEILNSAVKDNHLYSVLSNRPESFNRVIKLKTPETVYIFKKIAEEFNGSAPYREETLSMLLDMLLITVYRSYPKMFSVTDIPYFETVNKIQRQFENDISKAYSLAELSAEYHISKYYLSHIFKTVTGYSVMDYLKALRIAKAKALLTKTTESVSEIVKICGFSDSSNFSREFKRNTGLSPRDFRKKHCIKIWRIVK